MTMFEVSRGFERPPLFIQQLKFLLHLHSTISATIHDLCTFVGNHDGCGANEAQLGGLCRLDLSNYCIFGVNKIFFSNLIFYVLFGVLLKGMVKNSTVQR